MTSSSASSSGSDPAARHQRRELDELEVAHDAVGDVEVGVEAQLAQARPQAGDIGEELVAALAEHRLERLGGPEELLLAGLPLRAQGDAGLLGERGRRALDAPRRGGGVAEHERARGARHRDVEEPAVALRR